MHQSDLSDFQSGLQGCETALLADVETGTCLVSASTLKIGQEQLDVLCRRAQLYLTDLPPQPELQCLLPSPKGTHAFFRLSACDPEALCLTFAPNAPLDGIEQAALGFLTQTLQQVV